MAYTAIGLAFIFLCVELCHSLAPVNVTANTSGQSEQTVPVDEYCLLLATKCPYLSRATALPLLPGNEKVEIGVTFRPTSFVEIDDVEQRFSMQGSFVFNWSLPTCAHSGSGSRVPFCLYDRRNIWHPAMEHLNRIGRDSAFDSGSDYVAVNRDGMTFWQVNGQFDSSCSMTFKQFPFDRQVCKITIGMKNVWDFFVVDIMEANPISQDEVNVFTKTDMWLLEGYSTEVANQWSVQYTFLLRRRPECYVGSILIPMILLLILQLGVFAMPPTLPERASLSMTAFLSSAVLMGVINRFLPTTPELMYVVVYFAGQTFLGVLVTIYTLVMCRLTSNRENCVNRRFAITKRREIRIYNIIDMIAFVVMILLYCIITIIFGSLASSSSAPNAKF